MNSFVRAYACVALLCAGAVCEERRDYIKEFKYFINNIKTISATFIQNNIEWKFYFTYLNDVLCIYMKPGAESKQAIAIVGDLMIVDGKVYDISNTPLYMVLCKKINIESLNCNVTCKQGMVNIHINVPGAEIIMYCSLYENGNIKKWNGWTVKERKKNTVTALFSSIEVNAKNTIPDDVIRHLTELCAKYKQS